MVAAGALAVAPPVVSLRRASAWASRGAGAAERDGWRDLPAILARIRPPTFPARDFDVTAFGAVGDDHADNTRAFRAAIAACQAAGGGRVVVPGGTFMTGAIELKSGVNLHLAERATTIRFTRDPAAYPVVLTRFEGMECMNFSPLIYAIEQERLAITGTGTLDGNADCEHWWPWKGRTGCGWSAGVPNQDADRRALAAMVERHLQHYFATFGAQSPPPGLYHRIVEEVEGPLISAALAATRGNQIKAALLLGLNRNTLRKKISDLDIHVMKLSR